MVALNLFKRDKGIGFLVLSCTSNLVNTVQVMCFETFSLCWVLPLNEISGMKNQSLLEKVPSNAS